MTVNERLERLERSAGQGDHDLLLKLDAMSRQIQHQETLIKQLEDASAARARQIHHQFSAMAMLITNVPREFSGSVKLPIGSLPMTIEALDGRHLDAAHETYEEQIARAITPAGHIAEPIHQTFVEDPDHPFTRSAVHEKPHP